MSLGTVDAQIYDAFAELLEAAAELLDSPPPTVLHQGRYGETPDGQATPDAPTEGLWLETRFFPSPTHNYGLADDGPSVHQGFYQVSVCYRPGQGIVEGLEVAGKVIAAFAKGTRAGPALVEVKPWVSSVLVGKDRISHPITIPYRAMVTG